jgi:protocatechuate 3,4-dioxygenase alpha subunit
MTELIGTTPSQTIGPFLSIVLPWPDGPDVVAAGGVELTGRLTDGQGDPVPDGLVEIWQADADGRFGDGFRGFGRCPTDADGGFHFRTVVPGSVDGVQAPHVDVSVFCRGLLHRVVTRIYFPGEALNASDPMLGALGDAAARLVADRTGDGFRFDIRLQGDGETPFFAL